MRELRWIVFLIGILFSLAAHSQSGKVTKAQKKAEKTKLDQTRKQEKSALKARKKHESIQTKKVRKRMRKHRKADIHVGSYDRRPGFFKKLFRKEAH